MKYANLTSDYRGQHARIIQIEDFLPYRIVLHDGRILLDAGSLAQARIELKKRGIIEDE